MSKRCPDCGFLNEDSRIYCSSCGELLDPELRLLKDLNDSASGTKRASREAPPSRQEPAQPSKSSDEINTPSRLSRPKEKSSPVPWIILGPMAAAVVIALIVLS